MLNSITVSQLNTYVKSLIENDSRLTFVSVNGEISNFKNHFFSGHWYFTLKDKNASVRCVMFKGSASRVKFNIVDGLAVTIKGRVSLYEKDGQYQFYAEEMHPDGDGDLALAFKQVKEKLESEGLFNIDNKRPLIQYPKRIAVITSDTGAAVKDILNIISTRYPACEIVMCPVLVQGDMAARDMIKTLDRVYALDNIDTIIIGRGGGSAEDLHCFNDEALARKIYESPFPVISAVGHETDFTICDFVADVRASTPSHAAELAVPESKDLYNKIVTVKKLLINRIALKCNSYNTRLQIVKSKVGRLGLQHVIQNKQMEVDRVSDKIANCVKKRLQDKENIILHSVARIDALSPLKVMARGFSVVTKEKNCVTGVNALSIGDEVNLRLIDGNIDCIVKNINKKAEV